MSTEAAAETVPKLLAKFQKLGKRNKPLYQKSFQFINVLSSVLQVSFQALFIFILDLVLAHRSYADRLLRSHHTGNLIVGQEARRRSDRLLLRCDYL